MDKAPQGLPMFCLNRRTHFVKEARKVSSANECISFFSDNGCKLMQTARYCYLLFSWCITLHCQRGAGPIFPGHLSIPGYSSKSVLVHYWLFVFQTFCIDMQVSSGSDVRVFSGVTVHDIERLKSLRVRFQIGAANVLGWLDSFWPTCSVCSGHCWNWRTFWSRNAIDTEHLHISGSPFHCDVTNFLSRCIIFLL